MATFIKKLYACKINTEQKKWKCKIFINYGSIFSKGCAALKSNAAQDEANLITLEASQRGGWVSCRALSDASKYMTHTHSWNTHTYTYTWHTHTHWAQSRSSAAAVLLISFIIYGLPRKRIGTVHPLLRQPLLHFSLSLPLSLSTSLLLSLSLSLSAGYTFN